jgi:hypothetical protein
MFTRFAAAIAACMFFVASSASAATVVASGTTTGDQNINILKSIAPGSWELTIRTEAPEFDFDTIAVLGRTNFYYEYDDPSLSWGSESEDSHPFSARQLADGIALRFYIPVDYTRRFEDPRFPHTFYRYSEGLLVFTGSASSATPAAWIATLSAAPEPKTWAMMIIGFGLAGASLRRVRPSILAVR